MILWLDDVRNPVLYGLKGKDYKWVKNSDEFVDYIENNLLPDEISFDHDLGLDSFDGYWCAKWLVNYCIENDFNMPVLRSHSANPVGKKNIESVYNTYQKWLKLFKEKEYDE